MRSAGPRALYGALVVVGLATACGAGAGEGGGATDLPTRAFGPYKPLESDPDTSIREPVVLQDDDSNVRLYGPSALPAEAADGEPGTYVVFYTADHGSTAEIRRADSVDLMAEVDQVTVVLEGGVAWEGGSVRHPAVVLPGLCGGRYGLFYEAGDAVTGAAAIGYAESSDGYIFEKHPANPLIEATETGEGTAIGQPAAAWLDGHLALYYASYTELAIFLAVVEPALPTGVGLCDLAMEKIDADGESPVLDPVLGPSVFLRQFDTFAAMSPHVQVTALADRDVFDLWYAGLDEDGSWSVGFAGSHDGIRYKRYEENPVLEAGTSDAQDPSVVHLGLSALMFYTQVSSSGRSAVAVAAD